MRALTVSGDGFVLAERPAADPRPDQALVEVHHVIVTGRDAVHAPAVLGDGGVWGFEAAGVVARQAADGTGPAPGARVVGLGDRPGAWAEVAAFGAGDLAVVPESVTLERAAALAVPGLSALQAVRRLGPVLGRRVLVTGASGAVAWYAVQLAALAGAHVIAATRKAAQPPPAAPPGAAEVVADLDEVTEPVHGVIDVVGGAVLGRAFALLADGGRAIAVGTMSGEPLLLEPAALITPARRTLETFWGQWPSGRALGEVLTLIDRGLLRPEDPPAQPWTAVRRPAARSVVTVTR